MKRIVAVVLAGLALACCSLPKMDPAAEVLAKKAYDQLVQGQDEALLAEFEPAYRGQATKEALAKIRALIPPGQPAEPKMVGFNSFAGTGGATLTLTYVYAYPQSAVTTRTLMAKGNDGAWAIRGFNVTVSAAAAIAPGPAPGVPRPTPKPQPLPQT